MTTQEGLYFLATLENRWEMISNPWIELFSQMMELLTILTPESRVLKTRTQSHEYRWDLKKVFPIRYVQT